MANTFNFGAKQWATKKGSVLAYNSENNNFKPLPFTFTRSSSATRVNKDGLIEVVGTDEPRVDYLNNADGHLLLEPSRTNLIPYSTLAFNGGVKPTGWSIGFSTGTFSHEEVTYKGQGAVKHTQITDGRSYLDTGVLTLVDGVTYTLTVQFDLENCSVDSDSEFIVSTNGFSNNTAKRFSDIDENGVLSFQFTTGADSTGNIRIGLGNQGTASGGQFLTFSMPQLEAGSYATSYIPTSGSSVTRAAETNAGAGNSQVLNTSEGVLYLEAAILNEDGGSKRFTISNGSVDNRVTIEFDETEGRLRFFLSGSGTTTEAGTALNITKTDFVKVALKYDSSEVVAFVNGTKYTAASTQVLPAALYEVSFNSGTSGSPFYGKVKSSQYYNTALTDAQLIALTS